MRIALRAATFAALLLLAGAAGAQTYTAVLSGLQEVPPNASPASGSASYFLDAGKMLHCTIIYAGLLGTRTASHIHCCALPGVNASVLFPTSGAGPTSDTILITVGPLSVAQETSLNGGTMYQNVHSTVFGGGEIRGQITGPVAAESKTWSNVKALYQH